MSDITNKKKVLFLITKSNWGGAQRYVYDLATSLPGKEYETVVALGGEGELIAKLKAANIRVIPIPSLQRNISLSKELASFKEVWRILRIEQPDVLHVNSSKAGGIGAFLGRLLGVRRVIYTAHGWAFNEDRAWWQKSLAGFFHWLTILFSHQTITVSKTTKQQMWWPFTQHKMTVVHNGRALPEYLPREAARTFCASLDSRLEQYRNDIWIGTLGELHPVKCRDVVIKAMKELKDTGCTARHILIGTGELAAELKQLVKKIGLEEYVFFLGHVHEAAQYLKAFDIFVLSSRSEALAYVIVEAAQAGLPIVSTRVGGVPEIITSDTIGTLVPPHDPAAFAAALQDLIADTDKRTTLGAAAHVRSEAFTLAQMIEKTTAVYNNRS